MADDVDWTRDTVALRRVGADFLSQIARENDEMVAIRDLEKFRDTLMQVVQLADDQNIDAELVLFIFKVEGLW